MRMRVIFLMNSLFTGGAEFSTLTFYGWLASQGWEVKVVVLKKVSPCYEAARFGLSEVIVLNGNNWWSRVKAFNRIVKDFKPDIVHSVLFEANQVGRLSRMTIGGFKHMESLVNEMYSEKRLADPQVTSLKLFAYRLLDFLTQLYGVDHYHSNGVSVANHYMKKLWIESKRITVIHRGRASNILVGDEMNRNRVRTELGTGNRLLFINMARHEYQKGQDVLLDAVALLEHEIKSIQIIIIGREGNLAPILKEKNIRNNLQD